MTLSKGFVEDISAKETAGVQILGVFGRREASLVQMSKAREGYSILVSFLQLLNLLYKFLTRHVSYNIKFLQDMFLTVFY